MTILRTIFGDVKLVCSILEASCASAIKSIVFNVKHAESFERLCNTIEKERDSFEDSTCNCESFVFLFRGFVCVY